MKKIENIKDFLYQNEEDIYFNSIDIFPQTKLYIPFGIGIKNRSLLFNNGSFYRRCNSFLYDTISPLKFESIEYLEDHNILVLHSSFNFSLRIHYFKKECFSPLLLKHLEKNKSIHKNTFLGTSGKLDLDRKSFSFFQLISETENEMLTDLLKIKYPTIDLFLNYSTNRLIKLFDIYGLEHREGFSQFEKIRKEQKAYFLNDFISKQYDSILNKEIYFYSWNFLF